MWNIFSAMKRWKLYGTKSRPHEKRSEQYCIVFLLTFWGSQNPINLMKAVDLIEKYLHQQTLNFPYNFRKS